MSVLTFGIGVTLGVGLVFGVSYGADAYRSWRYHFRRVQELRERPPVQEGMDRFEIVRYPDCWACAAYGDDGDKVGWDTGEHPMESLRNILNQTDD